MSSSHIFGKIQPADLKPLCTPLSTALCDSVASNLTPEPESYGRASSGSTSRRNHSKSYVFSSATQVNWSPETNYDSSFGTRTLLSILSKDSMCVFGRFEKC